MKIIVTSGFLQIVKRIILLYDFVSDIPNVEKDLRLTKEDSELSSLVEKLVRFDIRFKIINPKLSTEKIRVNLHIDMEAQKSYRPSNPSYPILKLAVYY